jgi:hypothetical protein
LRPSIRKEAANARKKESRLSLQNRRKNTPTVKEAVASTPVRNESIIGSPALPY